MKNIPRMGTMIVCLMLSLAVIVSGCKSGTSAADAATDPNDPANANVVPVSNSTSGTASDNTSSTASTAPSSDQSTAGTASTAPASGQSGQYSPAQYNENNGYGQEPETYAAQAPPPLPQYQQPPCPQPGYMWTPGYWGWAEPAGYYWVPGAWVQAPYVGALWTPGYWGWRGGRYAFYRGYWGRHIGFYGGINYGFGYIGFGYQGGYWRGNEFAYNTAVVRVNTEVVRNVYNYRITNVTVNRASYNGGVGGVQYRPRVSEIYGIREEHTPPMAAQVQMRQTAMTNRETFYNVNHGRPAAAVETRAVVADREVTPPAVVHYERGERPAEARPMTEPQRPEARPVAEQHGGEARPAPAGRRPENRPAAEQHKPGAHPEQKPEKGRPGEPR